MLRRFFLTAALALAVGVALPGCVSVLTTVHTTGGITKQVRVQVESSHEGLPWQEIERNLARPGQGWSLKKYRQGPNTLILATQSLPDANLAYNTSLRVERTGWVGRRYIYQERIPLGQYITTLSAKAVAASIPVTIHLRMPGHITEATGADVSGNIATWNCTLGEDEIVLQATSSQNRYCTAAWTIIAALLALVAIAAWIKERFRR